MAQVRRYSPGLAHGRMSDDGPAGHPPIPGKVIRTRGSSLFNIDEANLMGVVQCVAPIVSEARVGVGVCMSMAVGVGMTVDKIPM